jgi:orotidine-5'-phosphate decarboxylase
VLSRLNIPPRERLMFAVDVPSVDEAKRIVIELGDSVVFYKLGLEIFMSGRYYELLDWLRDRGKKVFADLKFYDVPQTVGSAVKQLRGRGASFVTVHSGNDAILEAAVAAAQEASTEPLRILAVTVLTSFSQQDVEAMGIRQNVSDVVLTRAKRAQQLGCGGVIASGHEVGRLRNECGDLVLVIPGIRPALDRPTDRGEGPPGARDDQKRIVDVETAFTNGADYIVVGRPIKGAPDRRAAAEAIQTTIAGVFS